MDVDSYSTDSTIQDVRAGGAGIRHEFAKEIVLRSKVQYNEVEIDAIQTSPNAIGTVGPRGFTALASSATVTPSSALALSDLSVRLQSRDRQTRDTSLFNQTEFAAKFATGGIGHDLLLGVELGRDTYRNQAFFRNGTCNGVALNSATSTSGLAACVPLLNPGYMAAPADVLPRPGNLQTGRADTLALYAGDTLALGERVKLVGGVRHDRYKATITNSLNSANTAGSTAPALASQTVNFTSVRLGAIWQPTKTQSYYISTSTSFNPSLEQLVGTTGLTTPLPPERNRAYEAGAKWNLLEGGLTVDAALFQITKANARSQNADSTFTPDGTVRVRGGRIGVAGRIRDGWQVFGAYTHLDARIVDAIAVNTQGKVAVNTPRDSANLWTTIGLSQDWEIGGGATYMAKRFANNTNLVSVPGYIRTDATIAWRQPKFEVRLNLFNAFNVPYFDALIQSDGGRAVPGTGRTALLSINWHL